MFGKVPVTVLVGVLTTCSVRLNIDSAELPSILPCAPGVLPPATSGFVNSVHR